MEGHTQRGIPAWVACCPLLRQLCISTEDMKHGPFPRLSDLVLVAVGGGHLKNLMLNPQQTGFQRCAPD